MARIAGVNIPNNAHIVIGLQAIYGIGATRAKSICEAANIAPTTKAKDLDEAQLDACVSKLLNMKLKAICVVK